MAEAGSGLVEVMRSVEEGDARAVRVGLADDGRLVAEEIVAGPSCFIAYGEKSHTLRVLFDQESMGELAAVLGFEKSTVLDAVRSYFGDEERVLTDLMDECDAAGIRYTFIGSGEAYGIQMRR